ncbi:MAG: hypothetical protein KDB90_02335 [Planctomycetes bacterium]|nr:hypothetical protein [Planctomycetota bacterium]
MKWLKANIRFLVVAVVLIALLVLANGEFGDIAKSLDAKQNQAKTMLTANYRALFTDAAKFNGDPATVEGRKMQDRTQVTNALTTLVNERMTFETDPAYTLDSLPQGTSVDEMINFLRNEKKPELQRELGFQRYFGPDVRDDSAFGFKLPAQATLTEDQVRDYLRKLDMVRCVAHCVERTGVQRLDKLDFKAINEDLNTRGVPTHASATGEQPYFSGEGLEIRVSATEEALYDLLIELQNPDKEGLHNRYLSVETFKFEKPDLLDPQDALITAKITLVAYRVNPESSYPPDESQKAVQQSNARAPRPFR